MKILLIVSVLAGVSFGQSSALSAGDMENAMWLKYDVESRILAERPKTPLCTVPLEKSPLLRGTYKLGMSRSDFEGPVVRLADGPVLARRAGEVSTKPTFFEGTLIRLKAVYQTEAVWESSAEFAYVIATEFNLPLGAWRENGYQKSLVMFCDGWTILVEPNRVDLRNESAIARMKKAEAAERSVEAEKKKATFKP